MVKGIESRIVPPRSGRLGWVMKSRILSILFFLLVCNSSVSAQVKIRIFADQTPESAIFSVTAGEYELNTFSDNSWIVKQGTLVAISKFKDRLAVKVMNDNGIICDSILLSGRTGKISFLSGYMEILS